jgi:hypothetical protein
LRRADCGQCQTVHLQTMPPSLDPQAIGPLQMGPYSYLKTPLPAAWAAC